ncbi:protein SAAL1-like [Argiope bruennichi]|uniref:protein SAAL1-like n=1 Tax=Argiope bruennichi TaxID=94029 RepID=UPI0024958184|nr:protein SAAL1-like [Argiope bruennichi]
MSLNSDRNPSPPPELLGNEDLLPDRIGDSVYSKQWLYKTLMVILEWCESPDSPENTTPKTCVQTNNDSEGKSPDSKDIIELDPRIEDDACILWDMSANKEVAEFLDTSMAPSIFLDVIDKTRSPRLLEIVVGILGNMSSFDSTCQSISKNSRLVNSILLLTGTSDSPTLLQVFRVILCGVSNENTQNIWFEAFEKNPFFMENMKFIFENSLSGTVIKGTFQLLYSILNENAKYCRMWGEPSHIKAIIIAGKQSLKLHENLDNFFCVLNALCQYTPNIELLVQNWTELKLLFDLYFLSLDEEDGLPDRLRITAVFSCFDTYNTLLNYENMQCEQVVVESQVLEIINKIAHSVSALILDIRKSNMEVLDLQNPQRDPPRKFLRRIEERDGTQYITMMTEYEFNQWTVLLEIIIDTAKTLLKYTEKESEKDILEDILNSEVVKENIGVLII